MAEMKIFFGCTIPNRLPHLEASARLVLNKLNIQVSDAPFGCCPDPVGFHSVDHNVWLAMGAQNLAIAEAEGKNIVSMCNGCYQSLAIANHNLQNAAVKAQVNDVLRKIGKEVKGNIKVNHFVHVLHNNLSAIQGAITKKLSNLKVAIHAGCHYARPSEVLKSDDPMKPQKQRDIIAATGATIVDYDEESLCCGNGASYLSKETADTITQKKIDSAKAAGANLFVVNCPACFQKIDVMRGIPVLYITELLALAMGESFDSINLKYHATKKHNGFDLKEI